MLDNSDTATLDAAAGDDVVRSMHKVIEHQPAELKFKQTKIEALNFEIARMTHWRLCSSSMVTRPESSWDTSEPERFSGVTEQRARKASDLGAKRSHSTGYGEHLQRRAGVFGRDERA